MHDDHQRFGESPADGDRKEIILLRRRLEHHRRTLAELSLSAPGERLGRLYAEILEEIDSILERMPAAPQSASPGTSKPRVKLTTAQLSVPPRPRKSGSLLAPIAGLASLLFVSLGGLWFWTHRAPAITDRPVVVTNPAPIAPPLEVRIASLTAHPAEFDFGSIRHGGRYVHNFELANDGDAPLGLRIERSACRCLWFQYDEQIPPRGTIPLVVALDTSKLDPGPLEETIRVTSKADGDLQAEIRIVARVVGK